MLEMIRAGLARFAGVVAYVSVVVFPTLMLLYLLGRDVLPANLPTFLGVLTIAAGVGLGFFLASLIEIRPARPKQKNEPAI
ncbi:hypothetical protein A6J80_23320 (plasmid) [Paracoccus yeei]|uniref:Uncharacterized protein n=1 Tax=Paracoccus yeei TaxID=147645 RepID=A0A1V0GZD7_9RHOB|nr:hypothetical protein [Paracoccus yeei]ARC39197.1 hypothetical protein A6J80_23320 [Paracoccus yeei]